MSKIKSTNEIIDMLKNKKAAFIIFECSKIYDITVTNVIFYNISFVSADMCNNNQALNLNFLDANYIILASVTIKENTDLKFTYKSIEKRP